MLNAEKVVQEISQLGNAHAIALITSEGTLLESREKPSPVEEDYPVDPKMHTKLLGLFAAELWRQNQGSQWVGAELSAERLVVSALASELLVVVVGSAETPWDAIRARAVSAVNHLQQ